MKKTKCCGNRMRIILTAGAVALLVAGCVDIRSPKTVKFGPGSRDSAGKVNKYQAYKIAERLAREEELNPENYEIQDKKTEDSYWILFDHKRDNYKLGFPHHFAVHVSPDGKAVLFKDK